MTHIVDMVHMKCLKFNIHSVCRNAQWQLYSGFVLDWLMSVVIAFDVVGGSTIKCEGRYKKN